MGQITGEAYQCEEPIPSPTKLMRALDAFRGVFESDALGYSAWNIVNVWKETRSHLGGADFSRLNLLKTGFQDVSCYKRKGGKYLSACFDHSLVSEKEFLLQGHSGDVASVAYHPDGRSFISGYVHNPIRAWDLATGECLMTMVNQSGMQLFGCSFMSLHPQSNISEKAKKLMRQYGMLFDENDKKLWQEAVQRVFGSD